MSEAKLQLTARIGKIEVSGDFLDMIQDPSRNNVEWLKAFAGGGNFLGFASVGIQSGEVLCTHPDFDEITISDGCGIPSYRFIYTRSPDNKVIFERTEKI